MRLQKRFIYSGILSGVSFIILYAIIHFYLIVALLLSFAIYGAGLLIFKSKDIRIYDSAALARYNFEMSKLNTYKEKIKDKNIKEKLTSIVELCQKLTKYLETKPTNATPIYNSLDYYLTFASNRITEYIKIENIKEKTFVENKLILKMNVYLKEIESELNKLNREVINSKDKQINYELKRFEKLSNFDEEEGSENND